MTRHPEKAGSTEIWRHGNPSDPFSLGELDTTPPENQGARIGYVPFNVEYEQAIHDAAGTGAKVTDPVGFRDVVYYGSGAFTSSGPFVKPPDQIARDFDQVDLSWTAEQQRVRGMTGWLLLSACLVALACGALVWGMA